MSGVFVPKMRYLFMETDSVHSLCRRLESGDMWACQRMEREHRCPSRQLGASRGRTVLWGME